jgi:hypothetical protein
VAITYSTLNPYTLDEIKAHLGASGAGKDEVLTVVANGVTEFVEHAIARVLLVRTVNERRSGHGRSVLRLGKNPVVAVSALTILRAPADAAPETIAPTQYRTIVGLDGGIQLFYSTFSYGLDNIAITYTAGDVNAAALPPSIALLWLEVVKIITTETIAGASGATSVTVGPQTFMVKPSWPTHVKELLARLRRAAASV